MLRAGTWHRGQPQQFGIEAPAVASEWFFTFPTVPEGVWWRLLSVNYRFQADASAGFRNNALKVGNGPNDDYATFDNAVSDAGNILFVDCWTTIPFIQGVRPTVGAGLEKERVFSLPIDFRIMGGHVLRSATISNGLNRPSPAEQYSGIRIYAEPYIYEPPGEHSPNVGDGANRVDWEKLSSNLEKLATILKKE